MQTLLPFALFAFVASITPGPTNLLALTQSARHGLCATLPVIVGGCGGAAAIVLLVGLGVDYGLASPPGGPSATWGSLTLLRTAMTWTGIAWLSVLAWQLFRADASAVDTEEATQDTAGNRPFGLLSAAALQFVNPKTWMMAFAVTSVFAHPDDPYRHVGTLALVFLLIALPCMGSWALLGRSAGHACRAPRQRQRLNRLMALLLLASAWSALFV